MWIRTQNKQRIINTDQIIDIFVGRTRTKIIANTTCYDLDASEVILGEYEDKETCLEILDVLMIVGSHDDIKWLQLPLGGEVNSWFEDIRKIVENLYR